MKPTRRQELKTNELAETLAQIKEWFGIYGNYVIGGVVVVLLIVAGGSYYSRSLTARFERDWAEYRKIDREFSEAVAALQRSAAADVQARAKIEEFLPRMRELGANTDEPAVASEAWRWIGDHRLQQAAGLTDPKESVAALDQAEQAYRQALGAVPEGTFEVLAAKFGLAAVYESKGSLEQARQIYQEIADRKSASTRALSKLATKKIEQMGRLSMPVVLAAASANQPGTLPATQSAPAVASTRPAATRPAEKPAPATTRPASRPAE